MSNLPRKKDANAILSKYVTVRVKPILIPDLLEAAFHQLTLKLFPIRIYLQNAKMMICSPIHEDHPNDPRT